MNRSRFLNNDKDKFTIKTLRDSRHPIVLLPKQINESTSDSDSDDDYIHGKSNNHQPKKSVNLLRRESINKQNDEQKTDRGSNNCSYNLLSSYLLTDLPKDNDEIIYADKTPSTTRGNSTSYSNKYKTPIRTYPNHSQIRSQSNNNNYGNTDYIPSYDKYQIKNPFKKKEQNIYRDDLGYTEPKKDDTQTGIYLPPPPSNKIVNKNNKVENSKLNQPTYKNPKNSQLIMEEVNYEDNENNKPYIQDMSSYAATKIQSNYKGYSFRKKLMDYLMNYQNSVNNNSSYTPNVNQNQLDTKEDENEENEENDNEENENEENEDEDNEENENEENEENEEIINQKNPNVPSHTNNFNGSNSPHITQKQLKPEEIKYEQKEIFNKSNENTPKNKLKSIPNENEQIKEELKHQFTKQLLVTKMRKEEINLRDSFKKFEMNTIKSKMQREKEEAELRAKNYKLRNLFKTKVFERVNKIKHAFAKFYYNGVMREMKKPKEQRDKEKSMTMMKKFILNKQKQIQQNKKSAFMKFYYRGIVHNFNQTRDNNQEQNIILKKLSEDENEVEENDIRLKSKKCNEEKNKTLKRLISKKEKDLKLLVKTNIQKYYLISKVLGNQEKNNNNNTHTTAEEPPTPLNRREKARQLRKIMANKQKNKKDTLTKYFKRFYYNGIIKNLRNAKKILDDREQKLLEEQKKIEEEKRALEAQELKKKNQELIDQILHNIFYRKERADLLSKKNKFIQWRLTSQSMKFNDFNIDDLPIKKKKKKKKVIKKVSKKKSDLELKEGEIKIDEEVVNQDDNAKPVGILRCVPKKVIEEENEEEEFEEIEEEVEMTDEEYEKYLKALHKLNAIIKKKNTDNIMPFYFDWKYETFPEKKPKSNNVSNKKKKIKKKVPKKTNKQ